MLRKSDAEIQIESADINPLCYAQCAQYLLWKRLTNEAAGFADYLTRGYLGTINRALGGAAPVGSSDRNFRK